MCIRDSFAVRETENDVIFLRKLVPGATDRSYGIHVAELAGVPDQVITRAGELMRRCLLYTSDAADDLLCVDLGGRRLIKKKKKIQKKNINK